MNLVTLAKQIRKNILDAILKSKASHIASAFSVVDILTILYGKKYVDPTKKQFILSKGHAGISVYATLCSIGVISQEMFGTYYANGSYLGGHVSHKNVPGVCLSTGSLGGGVAVANGVMLANRIDGNDDKIYVIIGDGECNEGSIWEAALFAGHYKFNNLVVIVDRNFLQGCGSDKEILNLESLSDKWQSFGFTVVSIDGHDHAQIDQAINTKSDKPICVIANTVKGKGVQFMENNNLWHYRNIGEEDHKIALGEIDCLTDE